MLQTTKLFGLQVALLHEFKKSMLGLKHAPARSAILAALLNLAAGRSLATPRHNQATPEFSDLIHVQSVGREQRLYLVWTIDVDRTRMTQIIKVWDITPSAAIVRLLRRIEAGYRTYSGKITTASWWSSLQSDLSCEGGCSKLQPGQNTQGILIIWTLYDQGASQRDAC